METLLAQLVDELDRSELSSVGEASVEICQEIDWLEAHHAKLDGSIPLWARAAFIVDTADEVAAKETLEAIHEKRALLAALEQDSKERVARVAERFPPFGVVASTRELIEKTRASIFDDQGFMRRVRAHPGDVRAVLAAYVDTILETWVPGFDPASLDRFAHDLGHTRARASRVVDPFARDDTLGYAPVDPNDLEAHVAQRLLANGFHERFADLERWDDTVRDYQRLLMTDEVHAAIGVFAPMRLVHVVRTLHGGLEVLQSRRVELLMKDGFVATRDLITPLALPFIAAQELIDTLDEVFPGLREVSERAIGPIRGLLPVRDDAWLSSFYADVDASGAGAALEKAYAHTRVFGWATDEQRRNRARISKADRLKFWHDTPEEARESELEATLMLHIDPLRGQIRAIEAVRDELALTHPYLAMRPLLVELHQAVASISTDRGRGGRPRKCGLYGTDRARAAVLAARGHIAGHFLVRGDRDQLMHAAQRAFEEGRAARAPRAEAFSILEFEALAERLAGELEPTGFFAGLEEWYELDAHVRVVTEQLEQAKQTGSPLDGLFPFSRDEEQRREVARLHSERDATLLKLRELHALSEQFDQMLFALYPPATLTYALDLIPGWLDAVHAVCKRFRNSDGVYYQCVVEGRDDALARVRELNVTYLRAFGAIPESHAIMTRWAVGRMRPSPREVSTSGQW